MKNNKIIKYQLQGLLVNYETDVAHSVSLTFASIDQIKTFLIHKKDYFIGCESLAINEEHFCTETGLLIGFNPSSFNCNSFLESYEDKEDEEDDFIG